MKLYITKIGNARYVKGVLYVVENHQNQTQAKSKVGLGQAVKNYCKKYNIDRKDIELCMACDNTYYL